MIFHRRNFDHFSKLSCHILYSFIVDKRFLNNIRLTPSKMSGAENVFGVQLVVLLACGTMALFCKKYISNESAKVWGRLVIIFIVLFSIIDLISVANLI